jgi:hypothetical protein
MEKEKRAKERQRQDKSDSEPEEVVDEHNLVKISNNTFFATFLLRKTYEMLIFY